MIRCGLAGTLTWHRGVSEHVLGVIWSSVIIWELNPRPPAGDGVESWDASMTGGSMHLVLNKITDNDQKSATLSRFGRSLHVRWTIIKLLLPKNTFFPWAPSPMDALNLSHGFMKHSIWRVGLTRPVKGMEIPHSHSACLQEVEPSNTGSLRRRCAHMSSFSRRRRVAGAPPLGKVNTTKRYRGALWMTHDKSEAISAQPQASRKA